MRRKATAGIMLTLLMTGSLWFVSNIQLAKAIGTIYIRPDGSVDPPAAPINRDGNLYTFTDDIHTDSFGYSIVVEKDDIVLDGSGYALQGADGYETGIYLHGRMNVTVRNMVIELFGWGVFLLSSSNIIISGNTFANNWNGTIFYYSDWNNVTGNTFAYNNIGLAFYIDSQHNNIANNSFTDSLCGILSYSLLGLCNNNSIVGNNITRSSGCGVELGRGSHNSIIGNNISDNNIGLQIDWSSDNQIYHNYFVGNSQHAVAWPGYTSVWDDGYPSGGNYWSGYLGTDLFSGPYQDFEGSDGIGDIPYVVNDDNQDRYPLIDLCAPTTRLETNVTKGGETYTVYLTSNATVTDFDETPGSIKLTASGESGTNGYVSIIQPVGLNSSNIKVFLNNTRLAFPSNDPPRSISTNGTHYFIYFAFSFSSNCKIVIAFPIPGDIDYDGSVDSEDLFIVSTVYGEMPQDPSLSPPADIDDDGKVDCNDLFILGANFGKLWE